MGLIDSHSEVGLHLDNSWRHKAEGVDPKVLASHVAEHIEEAKRYNRSLPDAETERLADLVAEATEGEVHFFYVNFDPATKQRFYHFTPTSWGGSRDAVLEWLAGQLPASAQ